MGSGRRQAKGIFISSKGVQRVTFCGMGTGGYSSGYRCRQKQEATFRHVPRHPELRHWPWCLCSMAGG